MKSENFQSQFDIRSLTDFKEQSKQTGKHWKNTVVPVAAPPVESTLDKYTGPWSADQAYHLLRRTTFGGNIAMMKDVVIMGMDAAIDQLLADQPLPEPPLNYDYPDDPGAELGETWVHSVPDQLSLGPRFRSLYGWTTGLMLQPMLSIREKMVLFWHNHFVTAEINEPIAVYMYSDLLRKNALGNIREFAKAITIDPSMLYYLNGVQNNKFAPNENYARELLELFTIGKGPLAGSGDYTNYTEEDIKQMAAILTGWRVRVNNNPGPDEYYFDVFFQGELHDINTKQLSHRFDNIQVTNNGADEYKDLIDIIFAKEEVAKFMSRNLYRWFVHYKIDETIEQNVIEPLAQVMIDNDYEIKPALKALLSSEHFYDPEMRGCMIKNPLDYIANFFNQGEVDVPTDLEIQYESWLLLHNVSAFLQMQYYAPPQVAGWSPYYQEPSFYRIWINSTTIPYRLLIADVLTITGIQVGGNRVGMDVFGLVEQTSQPDDPNVLIDEISRLFLPVELPQLQKDILKQALIPGLPDFEWTVEYNNYLADPTNQGIRASVEIKIRSMLRTLSNLPEFNLS